MLQSLWLQHFSDAERQLLKQWKDAGRKPVEMASLLRQNLGTVARQLQKLKAKKPRAKVERPVKISEAMKDRIVPKASQMIKVADASHSIVHQLALDFFPHQRRWVER